MDNFLDRYQGPKLNQDQIDHLNSPITTKEIGAVIESLPSKQSTGPEVLVQNSVRPSKKTYHQFYSTKIETEGTISYSFYEATITLIPKPHKDPTKKESFRTKWV